MLAGLHSRLRHNHATEAPRPAQRCQHVTRPSLPHCAPSGRKLLSYSLASQADASFDPDEYDYKRAGLQEPGPWKSLGSAWFGRRAVPADSGPAAAALTRAGAEAVSAAAQRAEPAGSQGQPQHAAPGTTSSSSSSSSSSTGRPSKPPAGVLDDKLHVLIDRAAQRLQHALVHVWALFCLSGLSVRHGISSCCRALLRRLLPEASRQQMRATLAELPEGFWAKLHWLWERPLVRSIRITLSVANWGVRLPAIMALVLTQGSIIASQVSLPMLAPLLLGTGMLLRSIKSNASYVIPRLGLMVVLLWVIWFVNSVVQNTWAILRRQGRLDARMAAGLVTFTECLTLLLAGIVSLSMLGVNISGLLLPAGVCVAVASKDLLQNLLAGFFLFLVQPFRIGDTVAVTTGTPAARGAQAGMYDFGGMPGQGAPGLGPAWFEGTCEKVDLRYTVLRRGKRRLMVPNTAFVSREFMVVDEAYVPGVVPASAGGAGGGSHSYEQQLQQQGEMWPAAARPHGAWGDAAAVPGAHLYGGGSAPGPMYASEYGYGMPFGQLGLGVGMWQPPPPYMHNGRPATPIVPGAELGFSDSDSVPATHPPGSPQPGDAAAAAAPGPGLEAQRQEVGAAEGSRGGQTPASSDKSGNGSYSGASSPSAPPYPVAWSPPPQAQQPQQQPVMLYTSQQLEAAQVAVLQQQQQQQLLLLQQQRQQQQRAAGPGAK